MSRPTSCVSCFASGRAQRIANELIVQDEAEERGVDLEVAVVFEEPQVSELVHEEIDARTCRADHFGKGFLGDLRYPVSAAAVPPDHHTAPAATVPAPTAFRWS